MKLSVIIYMKLLKIEKEYEKQEYEVVEQNYEVEKEYEVGKDIF
jgi:hypothetical protein